MDGLDEMIVRKRQWQGECLRQLLLLLLVLLYFFLGAIVTALLHDCPSIPAQRIEQLKHD